MAIGIGIGTCFGGYAPWSPLRLGSSLAGWWRSDMGITLAAPAAARARWLDRGASKYFVGQDVASKRPTASGGALSFDATASQYLDRARLTEIDGTAYTIGTAQRFREVATHQALLTNALTGGATGLYLDIESGNRRITHVNVGVKTWGAATTNPETWVARHSGASGLADFCLNGVHQAQQALGTVLAGTGTFELASYVGAVFFGNVDIFAVVVYSDRKADAVTLQLDAYLTARRNGTTPPPGWVPSDEANLVLWLEQPTIYAGQCVTAWADQSGLGRHLAQATAASQLVWLPSGGPNNLPYLHADGADDWMSGAWVQAQPLHRFMMAQPSEKWAATTQTLYDGSSGNTCRVHTGGVPGRLAMTADGVLYLYNDLATVEAWERNASAFNGASSSIKRGDTIVNGNAGVTASSGLSLGAYAAGSGDFGRALIAEAFDANVILGAVDEAKAQTYLLARYGQ